MATIDVGGRRIEMGSGETISESMSAVGEFPDAYLFMIGGRPVPMDTVPPEDSEVRALRVASGG